MLTFKLTLETIKLDRVGLPDLKTTTTTSHTIKLPEWSPRAFSAAIREALGIKPGSTWKRSRMMGPGADQCWRKGRKVCAAYVIGEGTHRLTSCLPQATSRTLG